MYFLVSDFFCLILCLHVIVCDSNSFHFFLFWLYDILVYKYTVGYLLILLLMGFEFFLVFMCTEQSCYGYFSAGILVHISAYV